MANHLIWEAGRALKGRHFLAARKNQLTALSLHPLGVAYRATRPSNFRFVLAQYGRTVEKRKTVAQIFSNDEMRVMDDQNLQPQNNRSF
jgi:hypothetical protein